MARSTDQIDHMSGATHAPQKCIEGPHAPQECICTRANDQSDRLQTIRLITSCDQSDRFEAIKLIACNKEQRGHREDTREDTRERGFVVERKSLLLLNLCAALAFRSLAHLTMMLRKLNPSKSTSKAAPTRTSTVRSAASRLLVAESPNCKHGKGERIEDHDRAVALD